MKKHSILLDGESLQLEKVWTFAQGAMDPSAHFEIKTAPTALEKIKKAAAFVQKTMGSDELIYSLNTGFGEFRNVRIKDNEVKDLQKNILRSHSCGVGEELGRDIVMAMWLIRLNTFCRGHSGIRAETYQRIVQILEAGILGCVPSRGSVGASGDLAPSAHASLTVIGEGPCTLAIKGTFQRCEAAEALRAKELEPADLGAKEGLCLINGTQTTTALAIKAWSEGQKSLKAANLAAAMSIEGFRASHAIAHKGVVSSRNHPGCLTAAQEIEGWLGKGSEIAGSHEDCGEVQDPYSFRCAPQVHGAVQDEVDRARDVINREINSSTDNPLIFTETNEAVSGGNFHAIYTARVSDALASALTTLASISERRIAQLMDGKATKLPTFLIQNGGLNSGLMMVHVTAAALVSECKTLSFPASVDSIPTNNDREDHVSMGPLAGHKAVQVASLLKHVLAIELFSAAQALDLLKPLKPSAALQKAHAKIRSIAPFIDRDRTFTKDIEAVVTLIDQGTLWS